MAESGTSAIVTGGASGMGAATVRMLTRGGIRCVVADLAEDRAADVLADAQGAVFVRTDVSDPGAVQRAVGTAAGLGILRYAIACAGRPPVVQRLVDRRGGRVATGEWDRQIAVNLDGTFHLIRSAAEVMFATAPGPDDSRGLIVTTSSMARSGTGGAIAYSAAKAGVEALTLSAAADLARSGIRCVSVAPGMFDTPMLDGLDFPAAVGGWDITDHPKRRGRPEEFAALVAQLIANGKVNAFCVPLDAGIRD